MRRSNIFFVIIIVSLTVSGCLTLKGNIGQVQSFTVPPLEAEWIRNGEPLKYQDESWYPLDEIEVLQDFEMFWVGRYEEVDFYTEKRDIKPYRRLYTKFGPNQFRPFEKKQVR